MLNIDEFAKFGIAIEPLHDKSVKIVVSRKKLQDKIANILDSKAYNNSLITMNDLNTVISTIKCFLDNYYLYKDVYLKYIETCKKNYELITINIYQMPKLMKF